MSSESTGIRILHAGHRLSRPGSKERERGILGECCRSALYRQKKSFAFLILDDERAGGGGACDFDLGGGRRALVGGGRRGDEPRELSSITSASVIAGTRGGGADCNSL